MPHRSHKSSLLSRALIGAVVIYQKTISPDHGLVKPLFPQGICRYTPTCSQYAIESLEIHELRALPLIIKRLLRCHPFAAGGFDPVPTVPHTHTYL